jgi:hypothetical protein
MALKSTILRAISKASPRVIERVNGIGEYDSSGDSEGSSV